MNATLRSLLERRARPLPRRAQAIVTVVTVVALGVATVWAWRAADLSFADLDWLALAGAFFVAAPLTLGLKMLEYDAAARLVGSGAPWRRALRVAVVSSAANLLPIPGSLLVTARSLSEQGATYGSAAIATAIPGVAWLGLAGLIGGVAIVVAGSPAVGVLVAVAGCASVTAAGAMFVRRAPRDGRPRLAARIVLIEGSWVAVSGLRLWLVLEAIGVSATPAQALALAVAGAMSVAIGFFPGGLGAREAFIALLSPLIDLRVAVGTVLGVVDRVVWLSFLSLAMVAVLVARGREEAPDVVAPALDHAP